MDGPWFNNGHYHSHDSQQPRENAYGSPFALGRRLSAPYDFLPEHTYGSGTTVNSVQPFWRQQLPGRVHFNASVPQRATSDYYSNLSNDTMASSKTLSSQPYCEDVGVNHSLSGYQFALPHDVPPGYRLGSWAAGNVALEMDPSNQPPSDGPHARFNPPEFRSDYSSNHSNTSLGLSGALSPAEGRVSFNNIRSPRVPADHATTGADQGTFGSKRSKAASRRATVETSYRVQKQIQPRHRMNSNFLRGSHNIISGSNGRPLLPKQDARAAKICRFWNECNPNTVPNLQVCQSLSKHFRLPPGLLREQFQRQSKDLGYHTTASSKPNPTLAYQGKQSCHKKPDKNFDGAPTPESKNDKYPFACTHRCGWRFATKGNWNKHEEIHYPQHIWICPIYSCSQKGEDWKRRDHFVTHLKKAHKDIELSQQLFDNSYLPINSFYPRKCHLPGCTYNFGNWQDRKNHLAKHFTEPYDMSTWGSLEDEIRNTDDDDDDEASTALDDGTECASDEDEPYDEGSDGQGRNNRNFKDRHDDPGTGGFNSASGTGTGQGPSGSGPSYGNQDGEGNSNTSSSHYDYQGHRFGSNQMFSHSRHGLALHSEVSMNLSLSRQISGIGNLRRVQGLDTINRPRWGMRDFSMFSIRILGTGATATVDEVQVRGAKATMARKTLRYRYPAERKNIDRETYIMHRLKHSHIVRLISVLSDTSNITLLIKPAADYTLSHYLRMPISTASPLGKTTWKWFGCLVSGLQHIHLQDILHGDIKPDNILICEGQIFYADFGLSTFVPDDGFVIFDSGFMTKQYAAPEVKKGKRGKPSDVWSLGFVFLELATVILQQSIDNIYTSNCRSPDISYSNNLDVVAKWIMALQLGRAIQHAPKAVLTVINSCKAMTLAEPRDRPSATYLIQRIPSQSCCFAFDSVVRRWDSCTDSKWLAKRDISVRQNHGEAEVGVIYSAQLEDLLEFNPTLNIEQACSLIHIERETLHSVLATVSYPRVKQIAMLKVWLYSREWHEALTTGFSHTVQERSTTFTQRYLHNVLEQIGSQFIIAKPGIRSRYAAILDDLDMQSDSTTATDQQSDRDETEGRSCPDQSHHFCDVDPGGVELQVYSSANRTWLGVSCELDSGTRGDWVSEDLVNKLGVQAEVSADKSVYLGSQGQEIRPQRTVLLRWHFSISAQTRENWFHVMGGSFEIVLGSEFLVTHGVCVFDKIAPKALGENLEGTNPLYRICS